MKNMKIEINGEQPLDEVLKELDGKGYKPLNGFSIRDFDKWLVCDDAGFILGWRDVSVLGNDYYPTTTLQQLREMK